MPDDFHPHRREAALAARMTDRDPNTRRGRDRDPTGRARNARPRDGLGRPLAYGQAGVPRQPEGVLRSADETVTEAQKLLDQGRPFHAHEVFEDAWKASDGDEVALWQAMAQLAVGITHRLRGNEVGARRLLQRAAAGLARYANDPPHGIDVAGLRAWALDPAGRDTPRLR